MRASGLSALVVVGLALATGDQANGRTRFSAGDLFGILDGKSKAAKIINLWAGASCNFR